tara:strand:- start:223 stop:561 length:339 start_codon:yes stop_codon:yes gene_type:complete
MGTCDAGTPRLVTMGFGPTCEVAVEEDAPPAKGRSSSRYDSYQRHLPDVYTITARLMEVNGVRLLHPITESTRGEVDFSGDFVIRMVDKIRIKKTTPRKTIFIKVMDIFRRE